MLEIQWYQREGKKLRKIRRNKKFLEFEMIEKSLELELLGWRWSCSIGTIEKNDRRRQMTWSCGWKRSAIGLKWMTWLLLAQTKKKTMKLWEFKLASLKGSFSYIQRQISNHLGWDGVVVPIVQLNMQINSILNLGDWLSITILLIQTSFLKFNPSINQSRLVYKRVKVKHGKLCSLGLINAIFFT